MNALLKPDFQTSKLIHKGGEEEDRFEDVKILEIKSKIFLHIRGNQKIICYVYTDRWTFLWEYEVFANNVRHDVRKYPWIISADLSIGDYVILIRSEVGIKILKVENNVVSLIATESRFDDAYGFISHDHEVLFGQFFPRRDLIGVMHKDSQQKLTLYAAHKSKILKDAINPLMILSAKLNILNEAPFNQNNFKVYISDISGSNQDTILISTNSSIYFLKFDNEFKLNKEYQSLDISEFTNLNENIISSNVTNKVYKDLLLMNDNGLFEFKFNNRYGDYEFLNYNQQFSKQNGWNQNYKIHIYDINRNGVDDIVFSGQMGINAIEYNKIESKWNEILTYTNYHEELYSDIVSIFDRNNVTYLIINNYDNEIKQIEISAIADSRMTKNITEQDVSSVYDIEYDETRELPEQVQFHSESERQILRWVEKYDATKIMKDMINIVNGQVQFSLPLFDIPYDTEMPISYLMSYDSSNVQSGLLGEGWTTNLGVDHINKDFVGSIFETSYIQNYQNQKFQLHFKEKTSDYSTYSIENDDTVIKYEHLTERWIFESRDETIIYGGNNVNAKCDSSPYLQTSLAWPNWAGPGTDVGGLASVITDWYLREKFSKFTNTVMHFCYEEDKNWISSDKWYTTNVRLTKIIGDEVKVDIKYEPKQLSEYVTPTNRDNLGQLKFPVPLINKYYVTEFSILTTEISQNIKFTYEIDKKHRFLTGLDQFFSTRSEKIISFSYSNIFQRNLMSECILPTGFKIDLDYKQATFPSIETKMFAVEESPQVTRNPNFTVISYRTGTLKNHIHISVLENISNDVTFETEIQYDNEIISYEQIEFTENIVFIINFENKTLVQIFLRQNSSWEVNYNSQEIKKDTLIRKDRTKIVYIDHNRLYILEWHLKVNTWKKHIFEFEYKLLRFNINNDIIVVYDDINLFLYRNIQRKWTKFILSAVHNDYVSTSRQVLNKFYIHDNLKEDILDFLNFDGLQISDNIILLTKLQLIYNEFYLLLCIFTLTPQYKIANTQFVDTVKINVLNIKNDKFQEDITIKYINQNGIYIGAVEDISGKYLEHVNKISNRNLRKDARNKQIVSLNKDVKEACYNYLLFDPSKYRVFLSDQGVFLGDNTMLRNTGTQFVKAIITERSVKLQDSLTLKEEVSQSKHLKIYHNDIPIKSITLFSTNTILYRTPYYIIFQDQNNDMNLLVFEQSNITVQKLFNNETFLNESDFFAIISMQNTTLTNSSNQLTIVFRPTISLVANNKYIINSSYKLSDGSFVRKTAFERHHEFNAGILTKTLVHVVPEGDKSLTGFSEFVYNYNNGTEISTPEINIYDSEGQFVATKIDKETDDSLDETDMGHVITDKSGRLLVLDTSPYNVTDDTIGFIGFEDYEKDGYGSWKFDSDFIVTNSFSYTGKNVLNVEYLKSNVSRLIKPAYQYQTYLVNCMIRSYKPFHLESVVPYLKTDVILEENINVITLLGKMIQKFGEWILIQLELDFNLLREVCKEYLSYNSSVKASNYSDNIHISVNIRVEADGDSKIEVDHIYFFPKDFTFRANVYDANLSKLTHVVQNKAPVTKLFYDIYGNEIASVRDSNAMQFHISSIVGTCFPADQKTCCKNFLVIMSPENGFYETFDRYSFKTRWNVYNAKSWKTYPGELMHVGVSEDIIVIDGGLLHTYNNCIKFIYALETNRSQIKIILMNHEIILVRKEISLSQLNLHGVNMNINHMGTITILMMKGRLVVWYQNVIVYDLATTFSSKNRLFSISSKGTTLIKDLFLIVNPAVKVEYQNLFGETVQNIDILSEKTIIVYENVHDFLGRKAVTTKLSKFTISDNEKLLNFKENFVSISSFNDVFWRNGILRGMINQIHPDDEGFPYTRNLYENNPTNAVRVLGLPGKEYSVYGEFNKKYSRVSNNSFIENNFPSNEGFKKRVEIYSSGTNYITVFDKNDNRVAFYVKVPGCDHILSTYEYDNNKNLIKILPPAFHEEVQTMGEAKLNATLDTYNTERKFGAFRTYDSRGNLIRKKNQDEEKVENIFDEKNQLKFRQEFGNETYIEKVLYFQYDTEGQLHKTGCFTVAPSQTYLNENIDAYEYENANDYQEIYYERNPTISQNVYNIKRIITKSNNVSVIDELLFGGDNNVQEKRMFLFDNGNIYNFTVDKSYKNNHAHKILYPTSFKGNQLDVVQIYDTLGHKVEIGIHNETIYTASYDSSGKIEMEVHLPDTEWSFNREFSYNSPGYLTNIKDKYLEQSISYIHNGYGELSNGDGLPMATQMNAKWHEKTDMRFFSEHANFRTEIGDFCFNKIHELGFLTRKGRVLNEIIPDFDIEFPAICQGHKFKILEYLFKLGTNAIYGHKYSYGNHQELRKAKYFTGNNINDIRPLNQRSFTNRNISIRDSIEIWDLLAAGRYIVVHELSSKFERAIGLQGVSYFRDRDLALLLNKASDTNNNFEHFENCIKQYIIQNISNQHNITAENFQFAFSKWALKNENSDDRIRNIMKEYASLVYNLLVEYNFISNNSDIKHVIALKLNFRSELEAYKTYIPYIISVLKNHFNSSIGSSFFDLESFDIDANGNHQKFYTGFNRYEMRYVGSTNKLKEIFISSPGIAPIKYEVNYDYRGNMINARHLGILNIEYHPVSQRTTSVQLSNGTFIKFAYDGQGERVLKQVFQRNRILSEVIYFYDEMKRVLVDKRISYIGGKLKTETVTSYVYGPRGILGFIRNDRYYNVFTDNVGSIRLITESGRVVAAYDYLPYGQIIRKYEAVKIDYLFTGQEFDEELQLYNFHARLYDPSIGRFLQPDPKEQYFSPYKFAGNSPVYLVDPDGELATIFLILFTLAFSAVGAYLGGATANNRWNPLEWDYKDPGTWGGIVVGGVIGATLPYGFAGSVAVLGSTVGSVAAVSITLTLGGSFAYISAASANSNWDPTKWQWDSPKTLNALFQGFATGSSFVAFNKIPFQFASTLGTKTKVAFLAFSFTSAGAFMYAGGISANKGETAFWKWDWTSPETYSAMINGFDSGFSVPLGFVDTFIAAKAFFKRSKELYSTLKSIDGTIRKSMKLLKYIPKNFPIQRLIIPSLVIYIAGSGQNRSFDVSKWNFEQLDTYQTIFGNLFLKDIFYIKSNIRKIKLERRSMSYDRANPIKCYDALLKQQYTAFTQTILKTSRGVIVIRDFRGRIISNPEYRNMLLHWNHGTYFNNRYSSDLQTVESGDRISGIDSRIRHPQLQFKDSRKRLAIPHEISNPGERGNMQRFRRETVINEIPNYFIYQVSQILSSNFERIEALFSYKNIILSKRTEINVQNQIPFLHCTQARRNENETVFISTCTVRSVRFNSTLSNDFRADPFKFLNHTPISTTQLSTSILEKEIVVIPENGKLYDFIIQTNQLTSDSFIFPRKEIYDSHIPGDVGGVIGYWLAEGEKIVLKLNEASLQKDVNFVFTNKIRGSSICTKFIAQRNELLIFHDTTRSYNLIFERSGIYYDINMQHLPELDFISELKFKNGETVPELPFNSYLILEELDIPSTENKTKSLERINQIFQNNVQYNKYRRKLSEQYDRCFDEYSYFKIEGQTDVENTMKCAIPIIYRFNNSWNIATQFLLSSQDSKKHISNFVLTSQNEFFNSKIPTSLNISLNSETRNKRSTKNNNFENTDNITSSSVNIKVLENRVRKNTFHTNSATSINSPFRNIFNLGSSILNYSIEYLRSCFGDNNEVSGATYGTNSETYVKYVNSLSHWRLDESLLLANMFVRLVSGEKFVDKNEIPITYLDVDSTILNLVSLFENEWHRISDYWKLDEYNIDPVEISISLRSVIINGSSTDIKRTLLHSLSIPSTTEKLDLILKDLSKVIDEVIFKVFNDMK